MTDEPFKDAIRVFEALPGVGTMRQAISILALGGVEERHIRKWCRTVAEQYGVTDYVAPSFERSIMAVGLSIAQAAKLQAEG
jgi:hypothetical protein